jgi:membrane protein implicated in regulation of membrane protease activity
VVIGRLVFAGIRDQSNKVRLNRRAEIYLGRTFTLERPIVDGRGRLRVDDTVWLVEGPDLPAGARVQVIGVDNTLLRVTPF